MKLKHMKAVWGATAALGASLMVGNGQTAASNISANPLSQAERAANLYNRQVLSSDNQKIGKVENVVLDLESEHILYVVLNDNGNRVAVPPQVIGQTTGNTLHANFPKSKIDRAPKFTSNMENPAELGQAAFVSQVYQAFGAKAWWQGNTAANQGSFHNVHKLNKLIGMNVEDVNNSNIGKISNVVVDMPSGRLLYVVFAPASKMNLGNNLYALPSDAFTLSRDQSHLVTNIDQQKLAAAPHFASNSWPNINDSSFASQVYQYYGKQAWFNNNNGAYQPTGR